MAHTLESFAAAAHDLLTAEPGPTGREKVRALLEHVLQRRRLRGPAPDRRRAGAQDPLHRPAARLLHPRPQLQGREGEQPARPRAVLGHLRPGPGRDAHERLGPRRAPRRRRGPGRSATSAAIRSSPARPTSTTKATSTPRGATARRGSSASRAPTWTRSSACPTRGRDEGQPPVRRLGHAHHGAARSLRAVPRPALPRPGGPADRRGRAARSAAPSSSTGCPTTMDAEMQQYRKRSRAGGAGAPTAPSRSPARGSPSPTGSTSPSSATTTRWRR